MSGIKIANESTRIEYPGMLDPYVQTNKASYYKLGPYIVPAPFVFFRIKSNVCFSRSASNQPAAV